MTVHDSGAAGAAGPEGAGHSADPGQPGDVGPLGEEAAKLAEALQYWASERLLPIAEEFGGSQECAVCPVCRFMALVRGERPEVMAHLSDAAGALAAAFAAAVAPPEAPGPAGQGTATGEPGGASGDVRPGEASSDLSDEPLSATG